MLCLTLKLKLSELKTERPLKMTVSNMLLITSTENMHYS